MIDLHTHLLSGVDDGPTGDNAVLELARAAVANGIDEMAATPHIDHKHGVAPAAVAERLSATRTLLAAHDVPLLVHQGGEITPSRLMELEADELRLVALGGSRCLLLECPFVPAGAMFDNVVFRAQSLGFRVLLGHPERAPDFIGHPERVLELVERRALVQVTSGSLAGQFGRTVQDAAVELLAAGLVHVVSSDAHDAHRRPPDILIGLQEASRLLPNLEEHSDYFTVTAPRAVLEDAEVPAPPALRASRLRRFGRRLGRRLS